MLEVRDLSFSYSKRDVLAGVSFVASPGEIVSVIGANGAGKTTLLRVLATLAVPTGGLVLSDGIDAFALPLRYRAQIGYLPENPSPCDDLTVRDYLGYRARLKGEQSRRVRHRVTEAAELCRVEPLLKRVIRNLSSGQRRRVALADAILMRPRVLLLDDFLAGLDLEMREASGAILTEAAAFSSVIVTGHEIDDLARWSTRALVLRGGGIAASLSGVGLAPTEFAASMRTAFRGGAS